ncbi:MAG: hypothetical protein J5999_02255 [Oscillospiraceae bacterium]|nr:hypothetical protein [Oscillospiraceae bacterium]
MSVFFDPMANGRFGKPAQPVFSSGRETEEYQEGFLLGYLHNIRRYDLSAIFGMGTFGIGTLTVTAASSAVEPGVSPDFDEPAIRTGITNVVELHKKTLWTGSGKITERSGNLFGSLKQMGMEFTGRNSEYSKITSISCTRYVEQLITFWGFSVFKRPEESSLLIIPLFVGYDNIIGDCAWDSDEASDGVNSAGETSADELWNRQIAEKPTLPDSGRLNEFKRGFFDGYNFK